MAVSCTDYSARFDELQKEIDKRQNECTTLSDNAEGLNAMVSAIKKDDSLTDFSPIEEEGEVIGFRAVFKAAGEITVYNQQTGISVGSVDGKYYWMLCSEWLTDASGNKIEIGADSPLPRFGVQDDALVVSVDGGSSWQVLGSVDKNLITSVEEDEAQVVFTLSGGATIMIPKYQPFSIMLEGDEATLEEGGSVTFTYKITGAANPSVEVACGSKWSAVVTPGAASDEVGEDAVTSQGTITVSAAEGASSSEVLVLAGDDSGRVVAVKARITFKAAPEPEPAEDPVLTPVRKSYTVDGEGGQLSVTLKTNISYSITSSASWLRWASTKATRTDVVIFDVDANDGDERTAIVTFAAGNYSTQVSVRQTAVERYLDLSDTEMTLDNDGSAISLFAESNVDYTFNVNSSWLEVNRNGDYSESEFRIGAQRNASFDKRTATITFSEPHIATQKVNIVQDGRDLPAAGAGSVFFESKGTYNYRYGPSIIRHEDGSLDVWTSKEGSTYNTYADYTYQEVGTRSQQPASGKTLAQHFNTQHAFKRLMISIYGTGTSDKCTLKLYKWAGSYAATVASSPIGTRAISDAISADGAKYTLAPDNGNKLAAGEYMWLMEGASAGVGLYLYSGAGTVSLTSSESFIDGRAVSNANFQAKLRGNASGGYHFVDCFAYFHSDDGGKTWSAERDALFGTEGDEDQWSVCDPGAAYFGGWYYMAYTSAPGDYGGTYNHCYVARSKSPTGPWYKWNGSGWGGAPAKIIKFTGSTSQWGAGEPCIVVKDNTVYFYYTWTEGTAEECPTTRLATAPLSENWPANLTIYGEVINKASFGYSDSSDIKYVDDYGLFVAFHTYNRYRSTSAVAVWTSPDGKNFTYRGNVTGSLRGYLANLGVSADGQGHISLSQPSYIGYAYGVNPKTMSKGNWNTWFSPLAFSE